MSKALIVLSTDLSGFSRIRDYLYPDTFVVGCDGGADFLFENNINPNAIVGDIDSISNIPKTIQPNNSKIAVRKKINQIEYVIYPKKKDFTDSELALDFVIKKGFNDIVILGLNGDQADHMLSNIFLIAKTKYSDIKMKIIDVNKEVFVISGKATIHGEPGKIVSLMPIYGKVEVASCKGLKYDLSKYVMSTEHNIGTRNMFTKNRATVDIKSGKLLTIIYK